jgi:hypothetical protein
MKLKKMLCSAAFLLLLSFISNQSSAQVPVVSIISGIVKKVIIAIDLKVQELQNETIVLQNAEANVENNLHLNSLNNIGSWLGKERSLYQQYYKELATVKTVISDYDDVKRIISQQRELVSEYHSASKLFYDDQHFSASELNEMEQVYSGILQESVRDLEEVLTAVQAYTTQMSDAERFGLIHKASAGMQTNLDHLRQFNDQNIQLSLERASDEQDRANIMKWYGLR